MASVVAAFLLCRYPPHSELLQSLWCYHHKPSQGYSQHIRDDAYTPHVRWEGNKVIVHHFRSQELWSSKINLQFLTRFIPLPERDISCERRLGNTSHICKNQGMAFCHCEHGRASKADSPGNQDNIKVFKE